SDTLSVTVPAPCGEPAACPSGVGGGGGAVSRRGAASPLLRADAVAGSSLSPGRGNAAGRGGGRLRSGRLCRGLVGAGIWGGGVETRASRCGSSVGVVLVGAGVISLGRGGNVGAGTVARPSGRPTAAIAGTRLTMYGLGCGSCQTAAATSPAMAMTCTRADTRIVPTGSGTRPRAGPSEGRRRVGDGQRAG